VGDFAPSLVAGRVSAVGVDAANSRGTTVTPGASNADGAWYELVAATPQDAHAVGLQILWNTSTTALLDIGAGPSGSEAEMVSDLLLGLGGMA
jgi:hypothetical protein